MKKIGNGLIFFAFCYLPVAFTCQLEPRYAVDIFYGYFSKTFIQDMFCYNDKNEDSPLLLGADLIYRPINCIQPLLEKVGCQMEYGLNVAAFSEVLGTITSINPYIAVRFKRFPWNNYLYTTVAIGDGISFASDVPTYELWQDGTSKVLNYTMFEYTIALPQYKCLQLCYRLHHRCNCAGIIYPPHDSILGTTTAGFGIKYLF